MLAVSGVELPNRDAQLIARCCAGDLNAFGQVYALYERQIFRHAYYLLGHHEDADDAKQETFLRAYRSLRSFRSDSSLLTWLLKICSNLCYDRARQRTRQSELARMPQEDYPAASGPIDPQSAAERSDTVETVLRVLQGMPMPQRDLIVLRLIEGLEYAEIAQILGCSPGTAKMRVLRATHHYKERVTAILGGRE